MSDQTPDLASPDELHDADVSSLPINLTPRRRNVGRLVTAGGAALVLLVATVGFVAVNRYGSMTHQTDVFGPLAGTKRPIDGPGLDILLVGTDRRLGLTPPQQRALHVGAGKYGPPRPDSIMLVHLSESGDEVTVVSLPRESYVEIPAHPNIRGIPVAARKDRLNSAYLLGGRPLLVQTVEAATGVHIDHYLEVDFRGFLTMVEALDGVPVCVTKAIKDKPSGLSLAAGTTVVAGREALSYVRARAVDSEFGRLARQHRFLSSLVQKVTSTGTLINPLALNSVLDAASASITTDEGLTRDDLLALGARLRSIDLADILFFTVPIDKPNYRVDIGKAKNQSTMLWSDQAKAVFAKLAADEPLLRAPAADGSATAVRVAPSQVRIKVYNAAGVSGLAKRVADDLAASGYAIIGKPQNAKTSGATTTVIEYDPGFDQSLKTLQAALPGAQTKVVKGLGNTFVLLVGSDYTGVRPVSVSANALGPTTSIKSPTRLRTAADSICK